MSISFRRIQGLQPGTQFICCVEHQGAELEGGRELLRHGVIPEDGPYYVAGSYFSGILRE